MLTISIVSKLQIGALGKIPMVTLMQRKATRDHDGTNYRKKNLELEEKLCLPLNVTFPDKITEIAMIWGFFY